MLGLGIILAHLVGDYLLQNDWMAQEKTKRSWPAFIHGLVYSLGYLALLLWLIGPGVPAAIAWSVIMWTHVIIDRYRLAKHFIWAVNQLTPKTYRYKWAEAKDNAGYTATKPAWMAVWLMIIIDNTLHLLINTGAILWATAHG